MNNRAERRRVRFERNRTPGFTPVGLKGARGAKIEVAPSQTIPLAELRRGQRNKAERRAKADEKSILSLA